MKTVREEVKKILDNTKYSEISRQEEIVALVFDKLYQLQDDLQSAEFTQGNFTDEMDEYIHNWVNELATGK